MLGLVGLVSVYCDWVRWKVGSATSISVWQHVNLSEQICPRDTLACCWDIKQPTNQETPASVCGVADKWYSQWTVSQCGLGLASVVLEYVCFVFMLEFVPWERTWEKAKSIRRRPESDYVVLTMLIKTKKYVVDVREVIKSRRAISLGPELDQVILDADEVTARRRVPHDRESQRRASFSVPWLHCVVINTYCIATGRYVPVDRETIRSKKSQQILARTRLRVASYELCNHKVCAGWHRTLVSMKSKKSY